MPSIGSISFDWRDDEPLAVLTGDIDDHVAAEVTDEQLEEFRTEGEFVADLGAVTFIDSTGVSLLLRLRHVAGSVRLLGVPGNARTVLRLSGVEDLFSYADAPSATP